MPRPCRARPSSTRTRPAREPAWARCRSRPAAPRPGPAPAILLRQGRIQIVEAGDGPLRSRRPFAVVGDPRDRPCRRLGKRKPRYGAGAGTQLTQRLLGRDEVRQHRLVGRSGGFGHRPGNVVRPDEYRRGEGHYHHVYVVVGEDDLEHGPVLLGGGRGDQLDRVPHHSTVRDDAEEPALGRGCELRNLEAVALARVRSENTATSGIADDPHSPAGGKGLVGQDVGDVQELLQSPDPDHPGLAEEGVGGLVWQPRAPALGA